MPPPMTSKTRSTLQTSSRGVVVEVGEILRAEVERLLAVSSATSAEIT
jgi:hypothetical protein